MSEAESWTWHGPPDNIHVVEAARPHMRVCFLTSNGPTVARANLIAAAPDFFHAATMGAQLNLPDLMDWIAARLIRFGDDPNVDFIFTLRERAKLLRAAIAKAEGREP